MCQIKFRVRSTLKTNSKNFKMKHYIYLFYIEIKRVD